MQRCVRVVLLIACVMPAGSWGCEWLLLLVCSLASSWCLISPGGG